MWGDVHAGTSAFGRDVNVGFTAFDDGVYGDGRVVNIQIEPLGIVEIVDAKAKSAIEGLPVVSVCHAEWDGRSPGIVSRDTIRSPGLVPAGVRSVASPDRKKEIGRVFLTTIRSRLGSHVVRLTYPTGMSIVSQQKLKEYMPSAPHEW